MRGALAQRGHSATHARIIPAYAGSTESFGYGRGEQADHPRVCGEHIKPCVLIAQKRGSSPRMRGARYDLYADVCGKGIIPAYAGSTFEECCMSRNRRDHPRVCGEHSVGHVHPREAGGSSPRMRGAPLWRRRCWRAVGIIPAYAGSTAPAWAET